eukprot:3567648-Prymnesium_polylepis.1
MRWLPLVPFRICCRISFSARGRMCGCALCHVGVALPVLCGGCAYGSGWGLPGRGVRAQRSGKHNSPDSAV